MSNTTLELLSLITPEGELRLTVEEASVAAPGADDVVIRVEAAPINPSDLAVLLGPAELTTLSIDRSAEPAVSTAEISARLLPLAESRIGKSLALGNEGAGVVVDAGSNAGDLMGRVVSAAGGRMYTALLLALIDWRLAKHTSDELARLGRADPDEPHLPARDIADWR